VNGFDRHWEENIANEIPVSKKKEAEKFLQPLFDLQKSNEPKRVLDAGCGDGVHIDALTNAGRGFNDSLIVGLDFSITALNASQRRQKTMSEFVRGDIGRLPFANNQFDIVYSFGVLAYTANPSLSFSELCRVTRKDGYIGIWVYPQIGGLSGMLLSLARSVCKLTGYAGCRFVANCIVPFLGLLPTRSKVSLVNASWQQCREVVLVTIAPDKLYFPDVSEVESWFTKNNIAIISRDDDAPITLWGKKC
jgi:ubiquinone/menaquinone biosynthesis C-methylase UbiE